jgi:hypothetical protein
MFISVAYEFGKRFCDVYSLLNANEDGIFFPHEHAQQLRYANMLTKLISNTFEQRYTYTLTFSDELFNRHAKQLRDALRDPEQLTVADYDHHAKLVKLGDAKQLTVSHRHGHAIVVANIYPVAHLIAVDHPDALGDALCHPIPDGHPHAASLPRARELCHPPLRPERQLDLYFVSVLWQRGHVHLRLLRLELRKLRPWAPPCLPPGHR